MCTQQTYILSKPVYYTNPGHPLQNCTIKPGLKKQNLKATYPHLTEQQEAEVRKQFSKDGTLLLTFPHLDEKNQARLIAKGTIVAYHEAK